MTPPTRTLRGAMFALVATVFLYSVRTATGATLITVGSLAGLASGHRGWGIALVLAGAFIYREQCQRTPYARCLLCHGRGHRVGHRNRLCGPCRGRGVRMRWGRTVMNAYRRSTYAPPTGTDAPAARPARALSPASYDDTERPQPTTHGLRRFEG